MDPRKPALISTLLFLLAGATWIAAQAPDQTAPTFKVSVNYVDVDVTVTDANGQFARGLTRSDFELLEDGVPQKIEAFSLVELPNARPGGVRFSGRVVPADVRSNRDVASGRVYLIVLDDLNVSSFRTSQVRKNARQFVEQNFGEHDIAAVVSTSGRKQVAQEFTSDPARLLAAIDGFIGQRLRSAEEERIDNYYQAQLLSGLNEQTQTDDPQNSTTVLNPITRNMSFDPSNLEREQRAVGVLDTLRNLATYLEGVRGRRKALLLFSEGLDYPMADVFSSAGGNVIARATQDALNAAARANVNFYTIDPRGLIGMSTDLLETMKTAGPDYAGTDPTRPVGTPYSGVQALMAEMRLTQDSLRTLAEGTGGFAAVDTNSVSEVFDRIVRTNGQYYLLGYTPPNHPRNGRFHRIEVRVKRPGLKASARRGYPSPSGKTPDEERREQATRRALDERRGGSTDTSMELRAALNSPVQQGGLALSVHASAFRNTAKDASVALTVELQGDALVFAQQPNGLFTDTPEISYFSLNEDGRAQRGTRSALNLAIRPETYQRVKTLGLRLNTRSTFAAGRYQLRIGARDPATGASGTVFYDLVVPDFTRNPLMLSGLLVSSSAAGSVLTPQRDEISEKLLGAPATSRREFAQSETLKLLTEIYDNLPAQQARQVDLRVRLIAENGQEVFASRDSLANGAGGAKPWSTFTYVGQVPLNNIPPGHYLLRLEAAHTTGGNTASVEAVITVIRGN
ncbi:MAG: VWA domain-containing protein [Vicinamibacterales bacterium]|nr:VWA domain-containing protein [Vicinamibacterales bacterium]